jgi:hypothetical protein
MPTSLKHGQVVLENQRGIGRNEPVFIFRYADILLVEILEYYQDLCREAGSPENHLSAIQQAISDVESWQEKNQNLVQVPKSVGYNQENDHAQPHS